MPTIDTWTYKDIPNFYARVRLSLDGISDISLPDEYIDMPEKAPYAEHYAKFRVPNWRELDENKMLLFESAIVYKTASYFNGFLNANSIKKQELPTIKIEYWARHTANGNEISLNDLAEGLIAEITNENIGGSESFPMFSVITG